MRTPTQEVTTRTSDLENLYPDWLRVVEDDPGSSYFMTPDWALSWVRHMPCEGVAVSSWHGHDGRVEGVVCLARERERLHPRLPIEIDVLANLGSGMGAADHGGWSVQASLDQAATTWLESMAADKPLLLRDMDTSYRHLLPRGAIAVSMSPCPRLEIPADPSRIGRSAKFRKQLRYYRRRLEEKGISYSWIPPESTAASHIDLAIELHTQRRTLKEDETTFTVSRHGFHRSLQELAGPGRGPGLIVAEHRGHPIGAIYGFLWRDTFSFYQSGWEPEWAAESLGTVMIAEAIRLLGEAEIKVFDFLRGPESYKYRFGADDRVDETWLVPTGLSGTALMQKYRLKARSRDLNE